MGKMTLGKSRLRWEDTAMMDLAEIGIESINLKIGIIGELS